MLLREHTNMKCSDQRSEVIV